MSDKTHYRKVFKSDHLGIADLEDFTEEGKDLCFTIKNVRQEIGTAVAGRKGNFNIAYFVEDIKPLVLNATNSKVLSKITGSVFVQDWNSIKVELYIKSDVKMKGEVVGGVRIKSGISITKKVLEALYTRKKGLVAEGQNEGIERVLIEDETSSYTKVYNYLNKL
jgi:hypothetical protein